MRKAPSTGADTVVFDLEDAVSPDRKDEARAAVREVLSDPSFDPDAEVCVRVNPGDAAAADVAGLFGDDGDGGGSSDESPSDAEGDGSLRLDAVVVPKVTAAADVVRAAALFAERGVDLPVIAIIENAAGVLAAAEVARADPTDALIFGAEDFAADVGATRTDEGTEVLYGREHTVVAAAAAGVDAIDTLHTDYEDEAGLVDDAAFAVELGFDGKLAIHPAQVSVVNDAFTPDPERVEWAEKVLEAREAADAEGRGAFSVEGEMIDPPLIRQAEEIAARAEAAGLREE